MKKVLTVVFMLFMVTAVIFAVSGCSLFGEQTPPPDVPIDDLYGTWVCEADEDEIIYTFDKNMKFTKSEKHSGGEAIFSMGTYTLDGNILKTKSDVGGEKTREITEFDGQRMVFGSSIKSEYIKQKKK